MNSLLAILLCGGLFAAAASTSTSRRDDGVPAAKSRIAKDAKSRPRTARKNTPRKKPIPLMRRIYAPTLEVPASRQEESARLETPPADPEPARISPRPEPDYPSENSGLMLDPGDGAPIIALVLPGSWADRIGLAAGDRLWHVAGRRTRLPEDVHAALTAHPPGERLWAVAQRGSAMITLSEASPKPAADAPEESDGAAATPYCAPSGSALERMCDGAAGTGLSISPPLETRTPATLPASRAVRLPAGENLWINFPAGIPNTIKSGDILEARTSASMPLNSKLDFIAVPQGGIVSLQVVSARNDGEVLAVRLYAYKLQLDGGGGYELSAIVVDASEDAPLLRVSPGGFIAAAASQGDSLLAGPGLHFRLKLLSNLDVYEPPEFYQAGPGLWLRTVGEGSKRAFEITDVIAQRSAARAGLRKGDRIHRIGGNSAIHLSFGEAIRKLYGPPETAVALDVQRAGSSRVEKLELTRGVAYAQSLGLSFERDAKGFPVVSAVAAGSPAQRALLKPGDILLNVGDADLSYLSNSRLAKMLAQDLTGGKTLGYRRGEKTETAALVREWLPVVIDVNSSLTEIPYKR